MPDGRVNHIWQNGRPEAAYLSEANYCTFAINKTGTAQGQPELSPVMSCDKERGQQRHAGTNLPDDTTERHVFVTEPSDFAVMQEGAQLCSITMLYSNTTESNPRESLRAELSCELKGDGE